MVEMPKEKFDTNFSRALRGVFSFRKKYSLPVLFTLYRKEGLTFEQLYSVAQKGNRSISRNIIEIALKELNEKGYAEKRAILVDGKICIVHLPSERGKDAIESILK